MKTAIFLNTFVKMSNYDLTELSQLGIRLIAIVAESQWAAFNEKYEQFFEKIYSAPDDNNPEFNHINYEFSANIIKQELEAKHDVRIVCQSEDNMLLAATFRDTFNLPGMSYDETIVFRDKVKMKAALREAGINVPKFERLTFNNTTAHNELFVQLASTFGLPFLIKPTMMLGGIGVSIIKTPDELLTAINNIDACDYYEVESFIQGKLYHCDSIRINGKTIYSVCCEYSAPNFDFQLGAPVISMPLLKEADLTQRLTQFSESVLDVLRLKKGVSHMELFVTESGEIVFLEVGARSPGAIVTPMYRQAFNIAFEDLAFKIEMDVPFDLNEKSEYHYMSGLLPIAKGKVIKKNQPNLSSIYSIKWYVEENAVLPECTNLRDKAASITVWNKNYDILLNDFNALKSFQCLTLQL